MELACPVCNGFTDLSVQCPECGSGMEDEGALDNFLGPYSPYEEHDLLHMVNEDYDPSRCVHLLYCSDCNEDFRVGVCRLPL